MSSPGHARHVAPWPPPVQRAPNIDHSSSNSEISAPMPRSPTPLAAAFPAVGCQLGLLSWGDEDDVTKKETDK